MSAIELLHSTLCNALPHIHKKRLTSLCAAVQSACSGASICITELGRNLASNAHTKHNIKRMDRLVGSRSLWLEKNSIYRTMVRMLLRDIKTPIFVANSGFRVPFYRHVKSLGGHWVGRIRNRDFIRFNRGLAQNHCMTTQMQAHNLGQYGLDCYQHIES